MLLSKIRVVLVNTTHPGNIGSSARAMKTMGLERLYLVGPKKFPHPKAVELAAGADDILDKAVVVDSLSEALVGCQLVIGSSARMRSMPITNLSPKECAEQALKEAHYGDVALIFGREHAGLTNQELLQCHYHMTIPATENYSSLNLSQAVQVVCYEIYSRFVSGDVSSELNYDGLAASDDVEYFYHHLANVLREIDFIDDKSSQRLMSKMRRLYNRARLEQLEVKILRGMLTAVQNKYKQLIDSKINREKS